MKKIYIHIGVGKTGTTAIQDSMMLHRKEISNQGILYPLTGLEATGHQELVTLWKEGFSPEDAVLYSSLIREFEESQKNTMFISSEKFCFATGEFVRSIFHAFKGFEVKVIVYVRTQVAQIESTFLLWLRLGYPYGESFNCFFDNHLASFDYNRIVSPWAVFFGKEAIIARAYDHPKLKSDAFSGIQELLGIKTSSQNTQTSNQSLIPELSTLLCYIDQMSPEPSLREEMINAALEISSKFKRCSSGRLMDSEKIQRVKEYYLGPNLEFARKYLPEEDAVFFLSKA